MTKKSERDYFLSELDALCSILNSAGTEHQPEIPMLEEITALPENFLDEDFDGTGFEKERFEKERFEKERFEKAEVDAAGIFEDKLPAEVNRDIPTLTSALAAQTKPSPENPPKNNKTEQAKEIHQQLDTLLEHDLPMLAQLLKKRFGIEADPVKKPIASTGNKHTVDED